MLVLPALSWADQICSGTFSLFVMCSPLSLASPFWICPLLPNPLQLTAVAALARAGFAPAAAGFWKHCSWGCVCVTQALHGLLPPCYPKQTSRHLCATALLWVGESQRPATLCSFRRLSFQASRVCAILLLLCPHRTLSSCLSQVFWLAVSVVLETLSLTTADSKQCW